MSASAGKVLLMPKGDYNSETAYSVLDWVRYQGAAYVCKQASTGNLPTNTTYWQLLTQDGGGTDENAYHFDDDAETTIADDDYVPFYDTSASGAKKSLWSNVKSVLKTYFDTLYSKGHAILNSSGTTMTTRSNLQFSGMSVTDDSGNSKTVVTPLTPDYVDAQYNSTTTYTKGMTCISGNKRYRWINSAASTVPAPVPPNATYWVEESVSDQLGDVKYKTDGLTVSSKITILAVGNVNMYGYAKKNGLVTFYMRFSVKSGQTVAKAEEILLGLPSFDTTDGAGICGVTGIAFTEDYPLIPFYLYSDSNGNSCNLKSGKSLTSADGSIGLTGTYLTK